MVLTFLLALVLASRPRFCLMALLDLEVNLAIDVIVLTEEDIAIGLLGFSW